jgi:hypothetical protein
MLQESSGFWSWFFLVAARKNLCANPQRFSTGFCKFGEAQGVQEAAQIYTPGFR